LAETWFANTKNSATIDQKGVYESSFHYATSCAAFADDDDDAARA
jgi:hypothetical protein